jgi:hypothetical protein
LNSAKGIGNLLPALKNNQFIDDAIKKALNQNNMTQSKTTTNFQKPQETTA